MTRTHGSLRRRLLVGMGVGIGSLFLVVGALVYRLQRQSLYDEFDRALVARAHTLAMLVEQEATRIENDLGRSPLPEFSRLERPQYFEIWRPDGRVLDGSKSLHGTVLVPSGSLADVTVGNVIEPVQLPDHVHGRQVTLRFMPRQDPDADTRAIGPPIHLVLAVAQDTLDVEASLAHLRSVLLWSFSIAMLLGLGILVGIAWYGLRPVEALAARIANIDPRAPGAGFTSPVLPVELAPIGQRLDELVQRLAITFARERELTAELAHELRTPITGLKVTLELALSRQRAPEEYRRAMTDCLAICQQTHGMVDALLALARLDAGLISLSDRPVEIGRLVGEVLPPFATRARTRGVTIEAAMPEHLVVTTDPDQLKLVVSNLLDNAVSYVEERGTIRAALVATAGGGVQLRVANSGSTLTSDQVRHATERFWRGDAARASGSHAGLGLALCQKITALLGGSLAVTVENGWFVAAVDLNLRRA